MVIWNKAINDVKSTCGCTRLEFNVEKAEKILIENLTPCKILYWKSDQMKKFYFKIWRVVVLSVQNLSRNESFNAKSCFLKKHEKRKICRFHGVKWTKTWFFDRKQFFKVWHVQKILVQNLTRCKTFKSKSDALWKFCFKIWRVVFFLNLARCKIVFSKSVFKWYFQIFADFLSKWYQHQRTNCWKMTTARLKKIFYECVACVCLTFGTIFLFIAFFLAIGFLMDVMTISFAAQIDLYIILWNSEKVYFTKILFSKILNY